MRSFILLIFMVACGFERLPEHGATKLVFIGPPGDQVAGAAFAPAVQVAFEDVGGHIINGSSTITIGMKGNPANGTLSGTKTVASVDGVATFSDLSIDRLGTGYTLEASAGGVPSEASIEFAVAAGPPAKLMFLDVPQSATAGDPITGASGGLRVALEDASGNIIPTATDPVTAAIGLQAGPGTLSGTLTVAPTAGIATFADLSIDRTGVGYTLSASASSYGSADSVLFDVSPAAADPDVSTVVGSPASVTADNVATSTITVTVLDRFANGIPGKTVTLLATGSANTLSQPVAVTDAAGVATGTIASTKAESKTISANVDALVLTDTPAVTFQAGAAAQIAMVSGDGQGGSPGTTLVPYVVVVTDAHGNVVSNVAVTFGVTVGNGTLSTTNVMTDISGLASAALTLGTSGTDVVVAQATGLAGSPLVFGSVSTALSTRSDIAAATRPRGVAIGDLNGDGKRDVAMANNGANTVSVFLNTTAPGATSASFATRGDFATGASPNGVAIADLNGDGKPDLVVANQVAATISVLFNTAAAGSTTPSFAGKIDFATSNNPAYPTIGDLNGDGRPDVAVAGSAGFVSVLFNTTAAGASTPSFATKVDLLSGTFPASVAIGDLNGDGKLDLAAANATSNTVSVFLNMTAPGASSPTFTAKTDFAGSGPYGIALGDFSGDGKLDIVVSNQNSSSVSVFLNTTTPGALTPTLAPKVDFAAGTNPSTVALGDVNGDGRLDVAVTNFTSNTLSVLLDTTPPGATTPRFATQVVYATGTGPSGVGVGDLNGDGTGDVVAASSGSNALSVFLDTTAFGHPLSFATGVTFATGARPVAAASGDLNGDGKLDLVVANYNSNDVSLLLGTGGPGASSSFAPAVNLAVDTQPFSIALADLNGDGLLDLATANQVGTVSVSFNQTAPGATTPSFSAATNLAAGATPTAVAIGDVNGDGKPDLAVANQSANTLSLFLNATAPGATIPTFAAKVDFTTGTRPFSVAFADVNGDGIRDLVVGNFSSSLSVLLGTTVPGATTPTFAPKVDFVGGGAAVAAGDFNGDGKPDVAGVDRIFGRVSILLGTTAPGSNTPSFTAKVDYAVATAPTSIAIADLDQDGRLDCSAPASASPGYASVLLNTTAPGAIAPSFASKVDFASAQPDAVLARDINGDGKPDLVLANMNSDTISVLLGQ